MDDSSKNPDRAILESKKAVWTVDPEWALTEDELDRLVGHFGEFTNASESDPRSAIEWLFRSFMGMAIEERFRESKRRLIKVPKPSTIVARQMETLLKACEQIDEQLAQLDPVTRTWLDQYLNEIGVKDESGNRVGLQDLEKLIFWPIEHLIYAAHNAEGIASRGPNNTALRVMVEGLANSWEMCHGEPPITDKGRGLRDDPFLELCQEMAHIGHARLQAKGGGLDILQLSGIVADVLKSRLSRAKEAPQDK